MASKQTKAKKTDIPSIDMNESINVEKIRTDERRRVWNEINKHIKMGPLQGNGVDATAQRNGLVLATNIIYDLGI
jgi:hypothetical protein